MMSPRSENDWRALERAERLGHEPPGTVERLRAAESGRPVATAGSDDYDRLKQLAELLAVPATSMKRLADLKAATDKANAAANEAEAKKLAAAKAVAEAERKVKEHEDRMAREVTAHEATIKKERDLIADGHAALAVQWEELAKDRAALKRKAEAMQAHLKEAAA
jgi:hypothetical protein